MPVPEDYRHIKLIPADEGGFIVSYDEFKKANSNNTFDSRVFVKTRREVFDENEGQEALNRIKELAGITTKAKSK